MKWVTFNIIGLLCALAVFGTSATFAAASVPEVAQGKLAPVDTDDFVNNSDLSLGDLLEQDQALISSEEPARAPVLKVMASGQAQAKAAEVPAKIKADEKTSSKVVSSEIVSSKVTSSEEISSAPVSSEEISSAPVSSEPVVASVSETSSDGVYSEIFTSQEPLSSEQVISQLPPDEGTVSANPPPVGTVDEEMLRILSGAVQREIVGTNTQPSPIYYEAYKAQAVASHTYMEYYKQSTGSYPSMPYSEPSEKTTELVRSVMNQVMYYGGTVINASYHAASGGGTQSASYVWTGDIPYLKAAASDNDEYASTYTISTTEMASLLANAGIMVSGDASTWFDLAGATLSDGGFVDYISIGGTMVRGRMLRESILGSNNLKSCKITSITTNADSITFNTKGYGHGAGMSQLGAKGMASMSGSSYTDILTHYYAGIEIRG